MTGINKEVADNHIIKNRYKLQKTDNSIAKQQIIQNFNEKYKNTGYSITFENPILAQATIEDVEKSVKHVEEFFKQQQKANAEHAKKISFKQSNIYGAAGFFTPTNPDEISIPEFGSNNLDSILCHENVHYRDFHNRGMEETPIPDNIKKVLFKLLRNYALSNSKESITVLAEAIETPNDNDKNKLSKEIHLRKNPDGNLVLMLNKNVTDITAEEFESLGKYYQSINCPPLIPDYDLDKHGKPDEYLETTIRTATPEKTFLKSLTKEESEIVEKRNLLANTALSFGAISNLAKMSPKEWEKWQELNVPDFICQQNIQVENVELLKIANERKIFNIELKSGENVDIRLAAMPENEFEKAKQFMNFEITNPETNEKIKRNFTLDEITMLSKMSNEEIKYANEMNLFTEKNGEEFAYDGFMISAIVKLNREEIELVKNNVIFIDNCERKLCFNGQDLLYLAMLSEDQLKTAQKRGLFSRIDGRTIQFTGEDITQLSYLSDADYAKAIERGLIKDIDAGESMFK